MPTILLFSVHATTRETPFYLTYGVYPNIFPLAPSRTSSPASQDFITPIQNAMSTSQRAIRMANEKYAYYANKKRQPSEFAIGDLVLMSIKDLHLDAFTGTHKLAAKFCGPFKILKVINNVSYLLELPPSMLKRNINPTVHASKLRRYVPDTKFNRSVLKPPVVHFDDGHEEHEVEKVLKKRRFYGKTQYLVKYIGCDDHENEWIPADGLENCQELLQDFLKSSSSSSQGGGV